MADALEYLARKAASRSFYVVLLGIAAAVNAAGYLLTLWHDETVFDEVVHFYTSFAAIAALGWLALENGWLPSAASRFVALVACGIVLGLAWEAFEYAIGIIGNRHDTLVDLAMDVVGSLLAAVLINAVSVRARKLN